MNYQKINIQCKECHEYFLKLLQNNAKTKEGEFEGRVNGALTFHCDGVDAVSK